MIHAAACQASGFSAERAPFGIRFKDEVSYYRVLGVYVLPGEMITLEALDVDLGNEYVLRAAGGETRKVKVNKWRWQAPEKVGLWPIIISGNGSSDPITLNVFVMVPYDNLNGGSLNGYRIGRYPSAGTRKLAIHKPPAGFVEVTEENGNTLISPHFKLKHFLCKQNGGFPKYVVLKERLLLKLELLLEEANRRGFHCTTFHIMSGYRTPSYNEAIGNVKHSIHMWGGAADIFIDENPQDGVMDDLNGDGRMDYEDAGILYTMIDELYAKPWYSYFIGGLGRYGETNTHGPFVHVDVRGKCARW